MRAMVLLVFLLGLFGTGIELLFLSHTAGLGQLIPLVLMVMSVLVLGWHALKYAWVRRVAGPRCRGVGGYVGIWFPTQRRSLDSRRSILIVTVPLSPFSSHRVPLFL